MRCGTSGIGSANHLNGELLKTEGRARQHDHLPCQGSAPALQDLLGGQIDSVFDPVVDGFKQPVRTQIESWRSVARAAHVG